MSKKCLTDVVRSRTENLTNTFWCVTCKKARELHMKVKNGRSVRCTVCMEAARLRAHRRD